MDSQRYAPTAIALHWIIVALVFALYAIGWYMVGIPKGTPPVAYYYNLHKSIGIVAALPILILLFWRATHVPPPLPGSLAAWEARAAHVNHVLFYVCLVVLVVSGFIESNFTRFGVKFFGYALPRLGWEDKSIYLIFNRIHVYTSYLFAALMAVHIAAAFKHLLADRNGVFQRMLPGLARDRTKAGRRVESST
jgi:cytochrome b561